MLKYNIGRGCAVAGYHNLYKELNILPDVHIAEEARDNIPEGLEGQCGQSTIYNLIMSSEKKFDIMNDYSCTVNSDNRKTAFLNGDTAVVSWLKLRRNLRDMSSSNKPAYFNLCEDEDVDEFETDAMPSVEGLIPLFYNPLPVDLPTTNKDILILMAAYHGNVDRYFRLRRPMRVHGEFRCVIRGIYHNPIFAKWCSLHTELFQGDIKYNIQQALNARFIMNNDLSHITSKTSANDIPYFICYPAVPSPSTLEELYRRRPEMKEAIARTCIIADYRPLFEKIDPEPDTYLRREATHSGQKFYLEFLKEKADARGGWIERYERFDPHEWKMNARRDMWDKTADSFRKNFHDRTGQDDWGWAYGGSFNGVRVNMSEVELACSVTQEFLDSLGEYGRWEGFEQREY